jgi:hypothetical protein
MNNIAILPQYIMYIFQNNNTKRKIADIKNIINNIDMSFNLINV